MDLNRLLRVVRLCIKLHLNRFFTRSIYYRMFKKSIAIIDDDPDLLNLFSEALTMSGYTVSSFTDPLLAYQHIQENADKYSLVIVDEKIFNLNGLFSSTRLLEVNPKLNIILLSNFKDSKYNYKFNILKKRVSIFKLISAVNDSISKSISHENKF